MDERIGTMLGRYRLDEKIGEGGMAAVYRAFDTKLERQVAIKVITDHRQDSGNFLKRFDREAKALAKLSHPGIMDIHDYGDEDGLPYIVMEYLPNGTLKQYMGQPIKYQKAAKMLEPIAEALAYAHSQGIIHRDVKPANILFSEHNQPMIGDFGIVKVEETQTTEALTQVGTGIGTPAYMSPEQGRGSGVDHRTDIYALGVVFYELITGRRPYEAPTPTSFFFKQMTEPLPDPRVYAPGIPQDVVTFINKALNIDVNQRIQSMKEFAQAMTRFSAGQVSKPSFEEAPTQLANAQLATMMDSQTGQQAPGSQSFATPPSQPFPQPSSYDSSNSLPPTPVSTPDTGSYQPPKKKKKTWIIFVVIGGLIGLAILCVIGLWIIDPLLAPGDDNAAENSAGFNGELPNGSLMPAQDFYDCFNRTDYVSEFTAFDGLQPLVCDNFDDNRYEWYLDPFDTDYITADANITDGVLRLELTSKDSYAQFWQWVPELNQDSADLLVDDMIIYFKIRQISGPAETMIGVDYRENDSGNFYSFTVYEGQDYMTLEYFDDSGYNELSGVDTSNWNHREWNQISLMISGTNHYLTANDNELRMNDSSLVSNGLLSLWIGTINAGESVVYEIDDVLIVGFD
jgi:serine/threonine protein kinase